MTPGEHQQREIDRQAGQHERRMMERARFGSPFMADLFFDMADAIKQGREIERQVLAEMADAAASEEGDRTP